MAFHNGRVTRILEGLRPEIDQKKESCDDEFRKHSSWLAGMLASSHAKLTDMKLGPNLELNNEDVRPRRRRHPLVEKSSQLDEDVDSKDIDDGVKKGKSHKRNRDDDIPESSVSQEGQEVPDAVENDGNEYTLSRKKLCKRSSSTSDANAIGVENNVDESMIIDLSRRSSVASEENTAARKEIEALEALTSVLQELDLKPRSLTVADLKKHLRDMGIERTVGNKPALVQQLKEAVEERLTHLRAIILDSSVVILDSDPATAGEPSEVPPSEVAEVDDSSPPSLGSSSGKSSQSSSSHQKDSMDVVVIVDAADKDTTEEKAASSGAMEVEPPSQVGGEVEVAVERMSVEATVEEPVSSEDNTSPAVEVIDNAKDEHVEVEPRISQKGSGISAAEQGERKSVPASAQPTTSDTNEVEDRAGEVGVDIPGVVAGKSRASSTVATGGSRRQSSRAKKVSEVESLGSDGVIVSATEASGASMPAPAKHSSLAKLSGSSGEGGPVKKARISPAHVVSPVDVSSQPVSTSTPAHESSSPALVDSLVSESSSSKEPSVGQSKPSSSSMSSVNHTPFSAVGKSPSTLSAASTRVASSVASSARRSITDSECNTSVTVSARSSSEGSYATANSKDSMHSKKVEGGARGSNTSHGTHERTSAHPAVDDDLMEVDEKEEENVPQERSAGESSIPGAAQLQHVPPPTASTSVDQPVSTTVTRSQLQQPTSSVVPVNTSAPANLHKPTNLVSGLHSFTALGSNTNTSKWATAEARSGIAVARAAADLRAQVVNTNTQTNVPGAAGAKRDRAGATVPQNASTASIIPTNVNTADAPVSRVPGGGSRRSMSRHVGMGMGVPSTSVLDKPAAVQGSSGSNNAGGDVEKKIQERRAAIAAKRGAREEQRAVVTDKQKVGPAGAGLADKDAVAKPKHLLMKEERDRQRAELAAAREKQNEAEKKRQKLEVERQERLDKLEKESQAASTSAITSAQTEKPAQQDTTKPNTKKLNAPIVTKPLAINANTSMLSKPSPTMHKPAPVNIKVGVNANTMLSGKTNSTVVSTSAGMNKSGDAGVKETNVSQVSGVNAVSASVSSTAGKVNPLLANIAATSTSVAAVHATAKAAAVLPSTAPVPPSSPHDSYELSERENSSSDEDESESAKPAEAKKVKKRIPDWARGSPLKRALEAQYMSGVGSAPDPDTIFPDVQTCDLDLIFEKKAPGKLARRGSSGNWTHDKFTPAEVLAYKRSAGVKS